MKTGIINHKGVNYWAEIKATKNANDRAMGYVQDIALFKEGETSMLTQTQLRGADLLLTSIKALIENYERESTKKPDQWIY